VRVSETAPFVVYGFATTHDALVGERTLIAADVMHVTIPTPKSLGALCGIALRVPESSAGDAEAALVAAGTAWTARVEMLDRVR
jgi:hypothetical protein